jgi:transposase
MKLHANAKTCPNGRALIARRVLELGWSLAAAAAAAGVSERTAAKSVRRFRIEGGAGLRHRTAAPPGCRRRLNTGPPAPV